MPSIQLYCVLCRKLEPMTHFLNMLNMHEMTTLMIIIYYDSDDIYGTPAATMPTRASQCWMMKVFEDMYNTWGCIFQVCRMFKYYSPEAESCSHLQIYRCTILALNNIFILNSTVHTVLSSIWPCLNIYCFSL